MKTIDNENKKHNTEDIETTLNCFQVEFYAMRNQFGKKNLFVIKFTRCFYFSISEFNDHGLGIYTKMYF